MKRILSSRIFISLVVPGAVASVSPAHGQGSIQFLNTALSKIHYSNWEGTQQGDAPVGTMVGVFYGYSADSLTLAEATTRVTTPGLFNGGVVYHLLGTNPGEQVFLKIAAWFNANGPTPAVLRGSFEGITCYGESAVVQTTALGPTAGPGTVVWQSASGTSPNRAKPFTMYGFGVCPEPSVSALAGCALAGLLVFRRRRA